MPLLIDLRDQTFANQTGFFRDTNSLHLDALDDWTRQRLPVFRLRCAANKETSVHRGSAISVPQRCWWGYGRNSRQAQDEKDDEMTH